MTQMGYIREMKNDIKRIEERQANKYDKEINKKLKRLEDALEKKENNDKFNNFKVDLFKRLDKRLKNYTSRFSK